MINNSTYQNELKNITKGAGITAFGLLFMNVMAFVNNAIITRSVGADQYGLYVLATRVFEFVFIVSMLGFRTTVIRFVSMYLGSNNISFVKGTVIYCLRVLTVVSLCIAVLVALFSKQIAIHFFDRPEMTVYLQILMIIVPAQVFIAFLSGTLLGLKMIKQQVLVANFVMPLLFFVLISLAFLFGFRLNGLFAAHILSVLLVAIFLVLLFMGKFFKPYRKVEAKREVHEIWKYAVPLYANTFVGTATRLSPVFIMGYFLSNSEIGVFNVAFRVALLVSFSFQAFQMIFLPTISELFAKNDLPTITKLYKTTSKWILAGSLIIFSLILIYNKTILQVFGDEFSTGSQVLIILLCSELFNATTGMVTSIIVMSGRSKTVLFNTVLSFIMIVSLSIWLTPKYGNLGPAIAYGITIVLVNTMRIMELYHFEKIHPFSPGFFKPILS
nr:oligosaccharide flippase family protein [Bacteroidota bacterium]